MKLKTKLASLIIGFVMVASMLFFGVWAASSANVTLGGTISFTSTNVHAQVSGSISGAASGDCTLDTLTFSSTSNPDTSTWANKNIELADGGENAKTTITITVTNLASDRELYVSITDTAGSITNVNKEIVTENADNITLQPAGSKDGDVATDTATVTIELWVANTDLSVESASYAYLIDLNNDPLIDPSVLGYSTVYDDPSELHLRLNSINDKTVSGRLVIPEYGDYYGSSYPVIGIEYGVFEGCTGITSIMFPSTMTSISAGDFSDLTNLRSIVVSDENTVYEDGDSNVIIEKATNTLVTGCKTSTIPEGVESISYGAFKNTNITEITIPTSVTTISAEAFSYCSNLSKIQVADGNSVYTDADSNVIIETSTQTLIAGCKNSSIPEGVLIIYNSAFAGMTGLTEITLPSTLTTINEGAFTGTGLKSITIPGSVTTTLGIASCTDLETVVIESGSLSTLINGSFNGCTSLKSVYLPKNVTSIGAWAFMSCDNVTNVYYEGSSSEWANITVSDNDEKTSASDLFPNATIEYDYVY